MQVIAYLQGSTGEVIYSRDRYDYIETSDGKDYVDGGQIDYGRFSSGLMPVTIEVNAKHSDLKNDYMNRTNIFGRNTSINSVHLVKVEDIQDRDSFEFLKNNLTWGTYGPNGNASHKHINLIDADTDHLRAILDTQTHISTQYKEVIKSILKDRAKTFYRVCNLDTKQGLWYSYDGQFTGLIHDGFAFCKNSDLRMDFDPELVGWLSAVEKLEDLYHWFSVEDIKRLQKHGWYIYEYSAENYKFYERFQHQVICQKTSTVVTKHIL